MPTVTKYHFWKHNIFGNIYNFLFHHASSDKNDAVTLEKKASVWCLEICMNVKEQLKQSQTHV